MIYADYFNLELKKDFSKGIYYIHNKLSFSIRYALFPDDGQDVAKIFQIADERMYIEKSKI